jgi:organic radical activating enzyme
MTIDKDPTNPTDAPLMHSYVNGGYEVSIFTDGTKMRVERDASVGPVHPEQMDLKITDWCDAGCFWCHEKSTKRGAHGDIGAMLKLLSDLPAGVEIAIGGGDPLSHPEFDRLVLGLRDMGLIPSVTVNGRHIDRHRAQLERLIAQKAVYGVGISFFDKIPDWDYEHKVIHMIAGVDDPAALDDASRQKILVLGYKNFGRGTKFKEKHAEAVEKNIAQWYRELLWIAREHHVSFDTLAIKQLNPKRLFKSPELYDRRYMGDEGQFSMYVDGVLGQFSVSSYSKQRFEWTDINDMFQQVRGMRHVVGREMFDEQPSQSSAVAAA